MSNQSPSTTGLVTIRYVVMSILNRLDQYDLKSYKRLVQIAIDGFSEMHLFHLNSLEVVYLHMSTAKTVQLPSDYIQYTKIGYPIGGKLRVISRNDGILLPRTYDDTGELVGNYYGSAVGVNSLTGINNMSGAIFFTDHWRNGQYIGGLFGIPGGTDSGYYRIDLENRQIVFSGSVPRSEIVLEYISSGVKDDGSSLIPREAISALRTYVLWQMIECDQKVAWNEKERRKREHEESIAALRSFQNSFTYDEYMRMVWSSMMQAPKR